MDKFLAQWDADMDDPSKDRIQLYDSIVDKQSHHPHDVELLWRLVWASLMMADSREKVGDKAGVKRYTEQSLNWAKEAVHYGPQSMQSHKWYCAAVGRMSALVGTKERIQMGYEFKQHRDIAVSIEPNDRLMNHMYGRWCYELASLSKVERKLAETFFATPPQATYDEALESLLAADNQQHQWKANQLWLAKVYIALHKYHHAIECIDYGLGLPIISEDDAVCQAELQKLQKSYAKYR